MRTIRARRGLAMGVGAAAVVLVVAWCAFRPQAVSVDTASAREGPLVVTVDAEGRTRVRERYVVGAPVAGRLERVRHVEGDLVQAGAVLARIAPSPADAPSARLARSRVEAARAAVTEAQTRVRLAEAVTRQAARDADRARQLAQAGAVSPRAEEEAQLAARSRAQELAAARAHLAVAQADVRQASAAMLHVSAGEEGFVPVRVPASGRILRVVERSERLVAPGMPIAEIGDTRGLEVLADLLSTDAARVAPGMPVVIDGWGGDGVARGTVRVVEPAATTRTSALGVEEERVNVLVDVPSPPPALGDGYHVDVRIEVWRGERVRMVPASALVRRSEGWTAFVVRDGRARRVALTIGRIGGAMAEVRSGLTTGDTVVVFPSDDVQDGVRVDVRGGGSR